MIKKIIFFFVCTYTLFASSVGFVPNKVEQADKVVYTIQLFTQNSVEQAKKLLQKLPINLKSGTELYKFGESIKARYAPMEKYSDIQPFLQQFQQSGFRDAFIVKSSSLLMEESRLQAKSAVPEEIAKEEIAQEIKPQKESEKELSQSVKSEMLLKAQEAYRKGDENEAMIYYEMLVASGEASQKVVNNLCYLYGKRGAWMQAKSLIEKQEYHGKLLYAYAYGAVMNNKESYYEDLLPYISLDSSGRLLLLTGYYFEKREDSKKAASFYKMAYEKNKSDDYHKFAYARALDMEQSKEALLHYRELLAKVDNSHPLYLPIQKRVNELGE
ncbi:MAG: hypothetical protein WC390_08210 [Sulfurimonas sp.]|jgi:tetratricopeptide (TPR) repeat protein